MQPVMQKQEVRGVEEVRKKGGARRRLQKMEKKKEYNLEKGRGKG